MTHNEQPVSSHEPGKQPSEQKRDDTPAARQPAADETQPDSPPKRGEVRYQDPATTKPRPPTLGEQLARQRAEDEQREREHEQMEETQRKSRIRRRIMIGSGVGIGLVALVAVGYAAASPQQVTARCVSDTNVVASEQNCDESYASQHGGHMTGGIFFFPGQTYRYYYGGAGQVGQTVTGGTFQAPPNAHISTPSGKTVQRGGFGIRGGSGGS
jgi:hypothetical protein